MYTCTDIYVYKYRPTNKNLIRDKRSQRVKIVRQACPQRSVLMGKQKQKFE